MSEYKDFYYNVVLRTRSQNDTHGNYTDQYVRELEQQNAESATAIICLTMDIFNIKNKYEKLEAEKAELIHEFTVLKNGCKNEAIQGFCESVLNKFKEK